ncbi:sugar ABC transporter ATP-binding protein [Sinomonas humi]|uniref:ABC transporter domain-containing protein n=1 Tax=Sinomonas humi TaxID=1338436 RepID=A0A0B2AGZ2_9MICC|nr:sugar ABC transporter ATP-binding protein [Sinomonas humi]KHL02470.1 hypothetical protein LK10_12840 [Sinomonas humi]
MANSLQLRNASKTFGAVTVLSGVDLTIPAGQIHALLGQNGCGKSTLIKVLSGFHQADPGTEIILAGTNIDDDPRIRAKRIRCVHQDLALVDTLSAVENLALQDGFEQNALGAIRRKEERRRASSLIGRLGVTIDVDLPVVKLTPAERTMVAIARALRDWDVDNFGVLVLDEPTTSLNKTEADRLYSAVRKIADDGAAVLLVTHNLQEVMEAADQVTVMRDGKVAGGGPVSEFTEDRLVELIIGRSPKRFYTAGEHPDIHTAESREEVLTVSNLSGDSLVEASFTLAAGEVVGIAGSVGSGREVIAELIMGAQVREGGDVRIRGESVRAGDIKTNIKNGMAFVPSDRPRKGMIREMSVTENMTLSRLSDIRSGWLRLWHLPRSKERAEVDKWIEKLDIRPQRPDQAIRTLSGGNAQKVVLARALRIAPKVLILDEPTQGVDVGARARIYDLIASAARDGAGVLLCSSDAAELAGECDRVLVLRNGRIQVELSGGKLTEDVIFAETLSRQDAISA